MTDKSNLKPDRADLFWLVFVALVCAAIVLGACGAPKGQRLPGSPIEEVGRSCYMRYSMSFCVEACRVSYGTGTDEVRQCIAGAMRISPERYKRP